VLALEVMRETSELRSPDRLKVRDAKARAPELKMARTLIEQLSGEFDPTEHPNLYRKALDKLLASKRRFELADELPGTQRKRAQVVDLMDALKRSLAAGGGTGRAGRTRRGGRRRAA
jgi:DNA end-binding protein Ku